MHVLIAILCCSTTLLHHFDSVHSNDVGHMHQSPLLVAEDLALTPCTLYDMQASLSIMQHDVSRECYKFNTDKNEDNSN